MRKLLKISEIVTDAGTQVRVRLDDATVAEYAEAMCKGVKFPRLDVFHDGNQYLLADGFHRLMGGLRGGLKTLECEIHKGSRVDALKFALGANTRHGLRLTNADKRNSVILAIREFPRLSDRAVAEMCGVSNTFVAGFRPAQVSTVDTCPSKNPNKTAFPLPPEVRIGRDGKQYKIPPVPTSKPPPFPPPPVPKTTAPKPPAPPAELDRTGYPIPAVIQSLWHEAERVQPDLLTPLSLIRGALRRAEEQRDPVFAEVNFSSALANLDQAYADLSTAKPYAVCPTCQGQMRDSCTLCKGRGFISEHRWTTCVSREVKEIRAKGQKRSPH